MVDSSSFSSLVLYLFYIFFVNDRVCVRVYDSVLCSLSASPPSFDFVFFFLLLCTSSLSLSLTDFSLPLLTFEPNMGLGFRGLGAEKKSKKFWGRVVKKKKRENMTDTVRPPPSATTTMNNNDPPSALSSAPGPDDVVAVAALIDELKVRLLSFFYIYIFSF